MFSPLTINVMLHVYSICEPIENRLAPAVDQSLAQLCELGLISEVPPSGEATIYVCGFEATPKGRAWVELICTTPPPKEAFVDSRTGEMIKDRFST